jgi:hypothetical protein
MGPIRSHETSDLNRLTPRSKTEDGGSKEFCPLTTLDRIDARLCDLVLQNLAEGEVKRVTKLLRNKQGKSCPVTGLNRPMGIR